MASGSQNMTTYNARTVTGSNSAASPAGALLLSGAGRANDATATGDTWIFFDSASDTSTPWGIKHDQANNKIHIYGNNTDSVWTRMNTGDTYILGKVGIGYDPETSGNSYKLYVDGSSYFTDHMYIGRNNSAHIYLINNNWTKGTNPSSQTYSAIEYNDVNNSRIALLEATLDTSGNSQFNIFLVPNVASSTSWSGIILQKTNANVLTVNIAGTTTVNGTIHANGGYLKSTLNNNTLTIGSQNTSFCHFESSANIPFWFNNTIQMAQGKIIGGAGTQYRPFQLYLGRYTTSGSNALNANNPLIEFSNNDRSQYCQLIYDDYDSLCAPDSLTLVGNQNGINFICKNGPIWIQGGSNAGGNINRLNTTSGTPGNMQYNASRRGTQIYSNGIAFADPYNGNSNSDAGWIRHIETSANNGILEIAVGDDGAEEIIARQYNTSNNIARQMYLLNSAGFTSVSNQSTDSSYAHAAMQIREANYAGASSDTWGVAPRLAWHWSGRVAAQIGLASNGWLHEAPSTGTTFYRIVCETGTWGINITGNAATAGRATYANYLSNASHSVTIGASGWSASNPWGVGNRTLIWGQSGKSSASSDTADIVLYYGTHATAGGAGYFLHLDGGVWSMCGIYTAVWNDFAEYRVSDVREAGYVIAPANDGKNYLTTERMQPGARIISDTFGQSVGYCDEARTPLGVSGRVLAYPARAREEYKIGDCVCASPGGKVDIMTREEIMMYPDRIIGIVNEIPNYDVWERTVSEEGGGGAKTHHLKTEVKGRIWIDIK